MTDLNEPQPQSTAAQMSGIASALDSWGLLTPQDSNGYCRHRSAVATLEGVCSLLEGVGDLSTVWATQDPPAEEVDST